MTEEEEKPKIPKNPKLKSSAFFPTPFVTRDTVSVRTPQSPILQYEFDKTLKTVFPEHFKNVHSKICINTKNNYLNCLIENKKYEKKHDEIFKEGNFESLKNELKKTKKDICIQEIQFYNRCLIEGFKRNMIQITGIVCSKQLATFRFSERESDFKKFEKCCSQVLKQNEKHFKN
eukprot:gene876-9787_t